MSTLERTTDQDAPQIGKAPASQPTDPGLIERTIKPSKGWVAIDWNELYQSRELFDTLILRDVKIRYKQTVFGVAWAIVQPLTNMILFSLIFGSFRGVAPEGVPYPLFLMAGTVPWTFFTNSVSSAGMSLFGQQHLLTKIYFPRLYIPASVVGGYLIDLAIGFSLFAILFPIFHYMPTYRLIFLPLIVLLTFAAAFGLGLVMAAITILFRDLRFIIPYILQLMMFASPIFWQPSALPKKVQFVVALNPVSGIISAYRWSILGLPLDVSGLLMSIAVTTAVLIFGLFFFRKTERFFADLL